ncbi:proline-rich extensin-like receptor kinase (PERK) family [Klebsormidium nitens]|uniref:Proline-rich extensin-like receptor kinase (PERK) family n=1 Tax=Klebsormidium nitens TaxID=105231 RepID=A0A1Y1IA00_KLENI|nr:proline-rich extensin-like receptor kinase (PERK) family [Klebsormidium nitens]|eukprot:GAQ86782.1 proline-rich extensin-like receptor kinase (PERK) family [Klebsormidium nitens]
MQALCLLAAFVLSVGRVSTDYVVTGPSLAPPIPPGQCPYVFKDVNIKYAQGFCPTDFQAKNPVFSTSCCNALEGLIFQSRVQLANETGVLLLPQSSADACIKAAAQAFAPGAEQLFATCGINSTLLSIESGAPCGTELLTVYDFWEASGHSFPGIVGASCFQASDCTACMTQVNRKIASLRGNATLLSSPACQALGQIAMTAAAYPVVVANGISGCVRKVPILKLDQSPVCESLDWDEIDFSSAALSCGPAQIRSDRCCDLILGIGGQAHSIYANRTGHSIPQDQVQACVAALNSRLVKAGVTTSVAERCQLGPFPLLFAVGCYNYSNYDARIPDHLLVDGAGDACNPNQGNCSNSICQTQFDSASAFLANSSDPQVTNLCGFLVMSQYLARYDSLSEITARLNCFVNYPAPLALGFVTSKSRALTMSAIAGIVSACTVVLLILVAITAVVCKRRSLKEGLDECLGRGSRQWTGMPGLMLESFSFSTLKRATKNFSEDRLLGRGGSGKVFMGELRGNLVAVKVISREPAAGGSKEFQNEVLSMARLRHRHLVSLEGCCNSPRHYILVYEFMANGSLDDHLYPPKGGPAHVVPEGSQTRFLDWPTRMKIALGTAKGLTYLHEDCNPRILHRDIKPSNILLDSDFEAKVADFGLAKLTTDGDTHLTASIAGTWGFMAPEYAASGRLTDKSDVYSFGVVLLTLVAGRRPIEPLDVQDKVYLIEWAWTLAEADALQELLDVRLTSALKEHAAAIDNVTRIALLCIHSSVNLRPTMVECIRMLTGTAPVPALRPGLIFTPSSLATPGPSSDWNSTDGSAGWSGLSRGVLSNQSVVSGHSMLSNQSSLSKIELAARTESIEADDLEPGTGT